ncbi:hypothetical protein BDA99DRAFT_517764 [Phascolomyces articulosus]|uniref:Uncharacterized protein n=1 Tax=Phascolomyces articulosus TaxID=60185 RepID=A0AAD5PBD4_9FUNG|nr:hypothetical protein BDA99DRAFT_517764 [Phascolomyces articulosus]
MQFLLQQLGNAQSHIEDLQSRLQLMESVYKAYYMDDEIFQKLHQAHSDEHMFNNGNINKYGDTRPNNEDSKSTNSDISVSTLDTSRSSNDTPRHSTRTITSFFNRIFNQTSRCPNNSNINNNNGGKEQLFDNGILLIRQHQSGTASNQRLLTKNDDN